MKTATSILGVVFWAATLLATPRISHHLLGVHGLLVSGADGPPNGVYSLLATTNLSQSVSQWSVVAAGNFDAAGSFAVTNPVSTVSPWFFCVRTESTNAGAPDFSQVGFANAAYNVTGGAGGPEVTVTTTEELQQYTDSNSNYVIYVSGAIPVSGMETHIRPNKTLIGLGADATLIGGGLYLYRSTNVIIRNLTIKESTEDNIGLHYSSHVWIDHCTIMDATDGGIDLTQGTDYTTISWCKFYYTDNPPAADHKFVCLLGASDGESSSQGALHVTFHHNWWATNCTERMPSVRFGRVHLYNNYYSAVSNNYCNRTRLDAESRIENNYFENVQNPWEVYITGASDPLGKVFASNNFETNTIWTGTATNKDGTIRLQVPGTDSVFQPPYNYALDPAVLVKPMVIQHAGAGKGPFAP